MQLKATNGTSDEELNRSAQSKAFIFTGLGVYIHRPRRFIHRPFIFTGAWFTGLFMLICLKEIQ